MFGRSRVHRYTYADYVALERESPTKHECLDGEIYAMAGGDPRSTRRSPQRYCARSATPSESGHAAFTPRICGSTSRPQGWRRSPTDPSSAAQQHRPSPSATALNPTVLLEVTSDSSEEYDTSTKLEHYRTIPTLREFVIVSHRERRVTVHRRAEHGE